MYAIKQITPRVTHFTISRGGKTRSVITRSTNGKVPTPYEIYDETVKKISEPAIAPVVKELKQTNELLEKLVKILEEYKMRKLDNLIPAELLQGREKD